MRLLPYVDLRWITIRHPEDVPLARSQRLRYLRLSRHLRIELNHTVLGEGGTKLSGGEKQRLSIARAIIKDAPIVLLDEVTANMDVENELMIQMALQELLQDKTVIMIAHKLSTIKNVDQILVLENGKITQRGTHDQLVSQDGLYQKLWNIQYEASSWSI